MLTLRITGNGHLLLRILLMNELLVFQKLLLFMMMLLMRKSEMDMLIVVF